MGEAVRDAYGRLEYGSFRCQINWIMLCVMRRRSHAFSRVQMFSRGYVRCHNLSTGLLAACSSVTITRRLHQCDLRSAIPRRLRGAEIPFLTENVSAMSKMMVDMGIHPSGDVDRDFGAMMVPSSRRHRNAQLSCVTVTTNSFGAWPGNHCHAATGIAAMRLPPASLATGGARTRRADLDHDE